MFNFQDVVSTKLSSHIVYKLITQCNLLGKTQKHPFVKASEHLGIKSLTGIFVKTPKKYAIFDHMLLDGYKASFDNILMLLKERSAFQLQLKES